MENLLDNCGEGIYENTFLPVVDKTQWDEGNLIKSPTSLKKIVTHHLSCIANVIGYVVLAPVCITIDLLNAVASKFYSKRDVKAFKEVPVEQLVLPKDYGFADSHYQTMGLGTKYSPVELEGKCDWDDYLTRQYIKGAKTQEDFSNFFTDILTNPDSFIQLLKESGATAYRFSIERSVIEPEEGEINREAINLYKTFVHKLKEAGIEPYMTLCHFVHPNWFLEKGAFEKEENISNFVDYSIFIMKEFKNVKNIMTFNEMGVDVVQKYVLGAYPPMLKNQFALAGTVMKNMIITHCEVYRRAKEDVELKNTNVTYTHQYLKFKALDGGLIEKIVAYFFTNLFNNAIYNFFLTGVFKYKVPFSTNIEFSVSETLLKKYDRFMDFVGVQFYGFPRLKVGANGGKAYPGLDVTNINLGKIGFTFGSTCKESEDSAVMRFGIGFHPNSIREDYEEVFADALKLCKPVDWKGGDPITKKIAITETGRDASVQKWGEEKGFRSTEISIEQGDILQRQGFYEILQVLHEYKDHLQAFLPWTIFRHHIEWENGKEPCLGLIDPIKDEKRNLINWKMSYAAKLISEVYLNQISSRRQAV